ncbi:VOC family protein [Ornithinibacillus bavariensis]|uniref:VOC domain-containing protein n=1 Tax=Ornithinibacillus bavariensis TaxID=545502 RepID=A0A920C9B1_9BACI|nr:VOC family protein [Ornithinibacillus bavariensis]GIO28377.1 hypothetical protein J43TS3_29880 [Ornithinibacillus bavariensis]
MIEQILYNQIPVKNIPRAVKWFVDVLDFQFIWHIEDEQLAQLNLPSGQMLFLIETNDSKGINFTQNDAKHGVIGFHTKDIHGLYNKLKAHKVNVTEIVYAGDNLFLDFYDLDGNRFNVQCDANKKL